MSLPLRAVLFDRDETLARTDRQVYREAAAWAAERFGLDPAGVMDALVQQWSDWQHRWRDLRSHEDETAFWETYAAELAGRLSLSPEQLKPLMDTYGYERYMRLVPGALEVLSTLRAHGLKIGVLSNTLPSIHRTLEAIGIHELVDEAVATCLVGAHKPDPRAFEAAAAALGLSPAEILFVDDLADNVEAARAVGMQAVQIDLNGQTPDAIHDLRAVLPLALPGRVLADVQE